MLTGALGYVCSTSTRDGAQKSQMRKYRAFVDGSGNARSRTVSGRSRDGPGDMSAGGEPEGAGGIDDACRREMAVFVSGRHRRVEIHNFAGRPSRTPG
jgi:hypothetical protein